MGCRFGVVLPGSAQHLTLKSSSASDEGILAAQTADLLDRQNLLFAAFVFCWLCNEVAYASALLKFSLGAVQLGLSSAWVPSKAVLPSTSSPTSSQFLASFYVDGLQH